MAREQSADTQPKTQTPARAEPAQAPDAAADLAPPAVKPTKSLPSLTNNRRLRQSQVARLQRLQGNRAVSQRLSRPPDTAPVQRWPWDDTTYTVAGVIADRAAGDVDELSDAQIRNAALAQKMSLVRIMLNENWWVGPFDEWELERIWRLMSSADLEGVVRNPGYRGLMRGSYERGAEIRMSSTQLTQASVAGKMLFVDMILQGNWWVGPFQEGDLERIWSSLTQNQLETALGNATHAQLFRDSVEHGAEIEDLPPIPTLRTRFRQDVRGIAERHLTTNETMILNEMGRFGLEDPASTPPTPPHAMARPATRRRPLNDSQIAQMQELQAVAAQLRRAEIAKEQLLRTQVGYTFDVDASIVLAHGSGLIDERAFAQRLRQTRPSGLQPSYFRPMVRPRVAPFGDEQPALPDHAAVKAHYDTVVAEIGSYTANYPTLYALSQAEDGSQVGDFALASPEQARAMMGERLGEVLGHIRRTRPIVATDEDFYLDLKPIHRQMNAGTVQAPSGTQWNQGLAQWVAQDEVSDHEAAEFWIALGLGTLAAAAFIVAEFATLGSATFIIATGVGLGAGLVQAGRSWDQYEQLASAADATVSEESRLVTREQADSAYLAAVLDTVFLFLDALGPVVRGVRQARAAARAAPVVGEALEAGTRAASLEGLAAVSRGSDDAASLVRRAIEELGVEQTLERTGKSADELAAIAGRDSAAGRRLLAFAQAAEAGMHSSGDLIARLPGLADEVAAGMARADADRIVLQAVERLGPQRTLQLMGGWKKMTSLLGNESIVASRFLNWRNRLMRELEQFAESLRSGVDDASEAMVQRTGSTDFTSDLDISLLGPNASANRQAALSWLSGRLGVPPDDIGRLLYTDLFTDPRRMHLYDLIDDAALRQQVAARTAGFERELVWSRRLHEAMEAVTEAPTEALRRQRQATADAIRDQMRELGVRNVPYTPLSPDEIRRLSGEIDDLHRQLQQAARAGNTADQARLAEQIARKQAMINAAEGGGYFSGGGVRRSVSEREGFPGFTAAEAATEARRMLPAQQFTHVLDQLPKLDEAVRHLARAQRPDQIAAALKGIGKYGERFTSVVGESLARDLPEMAQFRTFASRFEQLLASARGMPVDPLLAQVRRSPESLVQGTRSALTEFERASTGILRVMQQRAAIETAGALGPNLANMQRLVRAHTQLLAAIDSVVGTFDDFLRIQRTAGQAVTSVAENPLGESPSAE